MEQNAGNRIVVQDINMSFGSMVVFMIKWALASIPAMLILGVIGGIVGLVFGGFFAGLVALVS